ncbi:MAG: rRNA maturation RNase YbeY [Deferribacterales bacterium]
MEVLVLMDNDTDFNIDESFFENIAEIVLKDERIKYPFDTVEISLVITDDEEMKNINRLYRKIDKSTDVLSFPINENRVIHSKLLGDIVISIDKARSQSIENGLNLEEEVGNLFIHGLLHLLGFDHERSESEEQEMFEIQDEIFDKIFYKNS